MLPAGQVNWQFFSNQQHDAEYWSYMNRVMIYGRIQPGDRKDSDQAPDQVYRSFKDQLTAAR